MEQINNNERDNSCAALIVKLCLFCPSLGIHIDV